MSTTPIDIPDAGAADTEAAERAATAPQLGEQLDRLRGLLEKADIEGARALVRQLAADWPESDHVRHLARVLAPPIVTTRAASPGHSRRQERAWLREHAREHAGSWLAILENQLIAADPDLEQVLAAVRAMPQGENALLHFEPAASS